MTEFISKMEEDECHCWFQQDLSEAMFLGDSPRLAAIKV
jgi:hypothetical protein